MRRLVVFALLLLAVASTSVSADGWRVSSSSFRAEATERGWGIPVSFGTDKKAAEYMVVFADCFGEILSPCDGVLRIPEDSGIVTGYIIPMDATRVNQYEMRWNLSVISDWDHMSRMEFDSAVGWRFFITPEEYCGRGPLRTLSLAIKEFNAKHWYVRAIFKFTYAKGSVKNYDKIILTVIPAVPSASTVQTGPSSEMAAFTAELDARFNKVGAYATNLDQRLTKLENAYGQFIQGNKAQAQQNQPAQGVTFTLNAVYSLQGPATIEVAGATYQGRSANLCLAPGTYSARAIINGRSSIWVNFNVYPGMKTVNIGEVK
jgi:hypothetical protein